MRRPLAGHQAFSAEIRGASAVEFALIAPVLVVLLLAGLQLVLYLNAVRRVTQVATSVSEMLSQAVPPSGSTTAKVNQLDLHFAYDATLVLFPYVMTDAARQNIAWWQDITITFAGIQFKPNGASCGSSPDQSGCFTALVGWTSTIGSRSRPCTVPQTPAADTAPPTPYSLPRSLFGPGSVVAVDVTFTFTPTFAAKLLPSLTITRSVFVQPRYAKYITFDTTNNDGIATLCPGFS